MYDEPTLTLKKIFRFIFGFLILAAAIWLVVWFVFFRQPKAANVSTSSNKKPTSSKTSSSTSQTKTSTPSSSSFPKPSTTTTTPAPSSAAPNLTNTGPGDVYLVAGAAAVVATVFYYVHLYRKLA